MNPLTASRPGCARGGFFLAIKFGSRVGLSFAASIGFRIQVSPAAIYLFNAILQRKLLSQSQPNLRLAVYKVCNAALENGKLQT